jgi:hypothetical protein
MRHQEELAEAARLQSLRDQFAAAALQGLCASFDGPCLDDAFVSGVARRAFDIADAMIAARERKEG